MSRDDVWFNGAASMYLYLEENEFLSAAEINPHPTNNEDIGLKTAEINQHPANNENIELKAAEINAQLSSIIKQYKNSQISWRILSSVEKIMNEYYSLRFQIAAIEEDSWCKLHMTVLNNENETPPIFVSLLKNLLLIGTDTPHILNWRNDYNYSIEYFMQHICPFEYLVESQKLLHQLWFSLETPLCVSQLSFGFLPQSTCDPILHSILNFQQIQDVNNNISGTNIVNKEVLLLKIINYLPSQDDWMLEFRKILKQAIIIPENEICNTKPTSNIEHSQYSNMINISCVL